jgi:hypothetical protein
LHFLIVSSEIHCGIGELHVIVRILSISSVDVGYPCRKRDLNPQRAPPLGEDEEAGEQIKRKSSRLEGVRLSSQGQREKLRTVFKRPQRKGKMTSDAVSSSNETNTDDQGIAAGMMNLAIVCEHVREEAASEVLAADNLASRSVGLFVPNLCSFYTCPQCRTLCSEASVVLKYCFAQ